MTLFQEYTPDAKSGQLRDVSIREATEADIPSIAGLTAAREDIPLETASTGIGYRSSCTIG